MVLTRIVMAAVALVSAPLFAANGTHFIGISPHSSAMGGTAVGIFQTEMEAMYRNPALLGGSFKSKDAKLVPTIDLVVGFGKNNAQATNQPAGAAAATTASSNDSVMLLPDISVAARVWKLNVGLAFVTIGGAVADYTGVAAMQQLKTELAETRFLPSVQYELNDWLSVGAGLIVGMNRLAINSSLPPAGTRDKQTKFGLGGIFGIAAKPMQNMTVGLTYQTKSKFNFTQVVNLTALGPTPVATLNDIAVEEPAEIGLGVSYVLGNWTFAVDFRHIAWSRADAFGHLLWKDQNAFSLGVQYRLEKLALRAGFNYAKSPIRDEAGINPTEQVNFQGVNVLRAGLSQLALIGVPAIAEMQITAGAGYQISDALGVDLGLKYSPAKTVTLSGGAGASAFSVASRVSQWEIVAGGTYRF